MGLFDSIASGVGSLFGGVAKATGTLFKTPIQIPGSPTTGTLGSALIGAGVGLGVQRLAQEFAPRPPGGGFATQAAPTPMGPAPRLDLGTPGDTQLGISRQFTTPGDTMIGQGFLPGVSGSGGLGALAGALGGGPLAQLGTQIVGAALQPSQPMPMVPAARQAQPPFGGGAAQLFRFSTGAQTRATAIRTIMVQNPVTGNLTAWRHVGRPVLFSGDLAHVKRVEKIGRKFASRRKR